MKIRELRLKNLNSLYGEWEIDFTDPAYGENGIFLISGPTGAGKTTVLDAICLALYGKTPRLAAINSASNEIMSRHTGDCFAEVVFETNGGLYQARWSQRRAKNKEDGKLQAQNREISEWNPATNQFDLLETYTSRVDDIVEEKTGMSFGRFTRSILLAQGQFAAFLQAKDDERSETLEQITGTEIYSRISKGVFERHKLEKEKLYLLEMAADAFSQMSDDEFFGLEIEKSEKDRQIKARQKEIDAIQQQQEWLRTVGNLRTNLEENAAASKVLQEEMDDFAPKQKVLAEAEKAGSAAVSYEKFTSLRSLVAKEKELLGKATSDLETARTDTETRAAALSEISKRKKAREKAFVKELATIREVRKLDTQIQGVEEALADVTRKSAAGKREFEKVAEELAGSRRAQEQSQNEQKSHREYLSEHERDGKLVSELPVLREQAAQWRKAGETADKHKAKLPVLEKQLTAARKSAEGKAKELKASEALLEELKKNFADEEKTREKLLAGKLVRECEKEAETLEERLRLEEKIIDLEAERSRLIAGQPCPLCGSTGHPFAGGNLPEVSATRKALQSIKDTLRKIGETTEVIRKLEAARGNQAVLLEKLKGECLLGDKEVQSTGKEIANLEADIAASREEIGKGLVLIRKSLEPFGIEAKGELDAIFRDLKTREDAWKHHESEVKRLAEASRESGERIAGLTARGKALEEAIAETLLEIKNHDRTLLSHRSNRVQSFAEKDPDLEERRLQEEAKELGTSEKIATEALNLTQQKVAEEMKIIADLSSRLKDNEPKLEDSRRAFEECLARHGFKDEADFLAKTLPGEEIETLKNLSVELDKRAAGLKAVGLDLTAKLASEEKKKLTKKSIEELEDLKAPLQSKNRELSEAIGQLTTRLKLEAENREKKKARLQECSEQRSLYLPWKQLNQLIGSADGKRYRNFAQGLTFEVMVGHANQQLAKMTDRYLLARDEDPARALTLNVVDHYQGGEVRPTTNLSGGETFLVSLALALGLSQMASDQVRVDSLFLDEGFGTLDEETLEEALDALATLKKEEKLIGVISHVPALKERLSLQLTVERRSGGKSVLSGPGVALTEEKLEEVLI